MAGTGGNWFSDLREFAVVGTTQRNSRLAISDRNLAMVLVVAGTLLQLPGLLWEIPGGKAINNALRILDGDVVYKDFWTMYAPGHFYVVAALFRFFGRHVWVQGVAAQLFLAIDGAILFGIVRRIGLRQRAAFLVGLMFVAGHWGQTEVTSYETALLFLLTAVDCIVRYAQGRGPRMLVQAGFLCGIGAWFKHDVAFHVAFGIVAGLSVAWLLVRGGCPDHWVSPLGVLIRVGCGAALGALPVVAILAWKAGPDAWRDLIVFPATDFPIVRRDAYPALLPSGRAIGEWLENPWDVVEGFRLADRLAPWVQANVPQVVFLVGVIAIVRRRRSIDAGSLATAAVCLAAMPLFWASAHVQRNTHLFSLWVFSILLGALVLTQSAKQNTVRIVAAVVLAVHAASFLVTPARHAATIAYSWPDRVRLDFPSVAGIRLQRRQHEFYDPIVAFIRQNVPESEPIYVGLIRHDAVVISDQRFYYLAGRRVASRYNELHPGVADREEVQREIIDDINRLDVRCAVLWDFGWPRDRMDQILANRRRYIPEVGATVLDQFFRREFREVARYGEYVIVWRRRAAMPTSPES